MGFADLVEIIGKQASRLGIGAEEVVASDLVPIPCIAVDLVRTHLHQCRTDQHIGDDLAGNRTSGHPRRRFARRGTAAATIIADTVFDVIGVIGMAGAIALPDIAVIF